MLILASLVLALLVVVIVRWRTRWPWRRCWTFAFQVGFLVCALALFGMWLAGSIVMLTD